MSDRPKHNWLEEQEEKELVELYLNGDRNAGDRLVNALIPLVWSVANTHAPRWKIDPEELFSAGLGGLLQALAKLDASRMTRVGKYAIGWITGAVVDECWRIAQVVELPSSKRKLVGKISKALKELETEGIPIPSAFEVSEKTGLALEKVEEGLRLFFHFSSLDQEIKEGSQLRRLDLLIDSEADSPEDELSKERWEILSDEDSVEIDATLERLGGDVIKNWLCLVGVSKSSPASEAGPRLITEKIQKSRIVSDLSVFVRMPQLAYENSTIMSSSFILVRHRWLLKFGRPLVPDM